MPARLAPVVFAVSVLLGAAACGPDEGQQLPSQSSASGGRKGAKREAASASGAATASAGPVAPTAHSKRPNILFVLADDQRADTLPCMPKLAKLLGARGSTFKNNFATTPLCCPGRSSVLTGKYAHNHKVLSNGDIEDEDGDKSPGAIDFRDNGNESKTVAGWLQAAGYRTAYFGKYLNAYDKLLETVPNHVPPHWDEWHAFSHAEFFDFDLVERGLGEAKAKRRCYLSGEKGEDRGEKKRVKKCKQDADEVVRDGKENYSTDVLRDQTIAFIRKAHAEGKPWFVHLAPKSPHGPFLSPARYQPDPDVAKFTKEAEDRLASCALFDWKDRPASYLEQDMSDKPQWIQESQKSKRADPERLERIRRLQLVSVLATEDAIEAIMGVLKELGVEDDTIVVYTGDNGFAWGEHWHTHKNCAYDECAKVPMVVLDPRAKTGAQNVEVFTLNIDLAPTFAAWAGATAPADINGRSFAGLVDGTFQGPWPRRHVLTECWGPGTEGRPDTHAAVRTSRWKYVEHYQDPQRTTVRSHKAGGQDVELYDLDADPHELDNLLRLDAAGLERTGKTQADVDAQVKELKVELERLKKE